MSGDQGSKGRSGFASLVKAIVSEMPFTAALFALSSPFILLGTVASIEWLLVFGILVSFAALLTGMFLE